MKSGSVKWFNIVKGFGFITPNEPGVDLFVHFKNIVGDGFRSLTAGDRVTYDEEQAAKGLQAINVKKLGE